jgi:hypothetical protein
MKLIRRTKKNCLSGGVNTGGANKQLQEKTHAKNLAEEQQVSDLISSHHFRPQEQD